jgi:hypothetical protein
MNNPFDEQAALDDLLTERYGEQIIGAVDNVELVEEEDTLQEESESYKVAP